MKAQAAERALTALVRDVDEHQAIVADCLLWFDGFMAAFPADRTCHTPHREKLIRLNAALQDIIDLQGPSITDREISF
ncbi:MAG: hypothetical protein WCO83_02340 [Alphaproteobacteria bacterium]